MHRKRGDVVPACFVAMLFFIAIMYRKIVIIYYIYYLQIVSSIYKIFGVPLTLEFFSLLFN